VAARHYAPLRTLRTEGKVTLAENDVTVELGGARTYVRDAEALRLAVAPRVARWSTAQRNADASVYLRHPTGDRRPSESIAIHVPVEHEKLILTFKAVLGLALSFAAN